MINWFINLNYVCQALIATLFTYGVTALGAALVFFFKRVNKNLLDAMLGISAGVMIAASFFSLLLPALESLESLKLNISIIIIGFMSGGILLFIGDKVCDRLVTKSNKRVLMLIISITLHNIPEGLAVGVAFGSTFFGLDGATVLSAAMLALGIGIQNFPEGTAVSVPLMREGMNRKRAFFYGQLSGIVEPISGVIGAILVIKMRMLLPFLLAFAAGAMIYVVVEELIPESQSNEKKDLMALFTLIGFSIMMLLDVVFG